MDTVFILSFLALITVWVFMFIVFFNPKRLQILKRNKELTQKNILIGAVVTSIILFIIIGVAVLDPANNDHGELISKNVVNVEDNKEVKIAQPENLNINYRIVSDEKRGNTTRKVNVELPKRVSEKELRQIANEIKNEDSNSYERVFIMYRIYPEKSIAAWATTHFDPNLKIHLIGLDSQKYQKLINQKIDIDGELLDDWLSTNGTDHITVIYKKGQQYFKKNFYIDGASKPYALLKDGNKFRFKNSDENVYFVVDEKGNLEYWGESGNFTTARHIENK